MKEQAQEICEIIRKREITQLVHFTHPDNVNTIKKDGLLPNISLVKRSYKRNDYERWDGLDGVCLSVTQHNVWVCSRFIRENKLPNPPKYIHIKPEVLLHVDCMFFDCNAASSKFKNVEEYPAEYLRSAAAFESMFADEIIESKRIKKRNKEWEPYFSTSEQAEIIVAEVPPEYILEIV